MFKTLPPKKQQPQVWVELNGEPAQLPEGMPLAAALLQHGLKSLRQSRLSDTKRAPYCMMGVCYECLIEINGIPNQQACMREVSEGMQIRTAHSHKATTAGEHTHAG